MRQAGLARAPLASGPEAFDRWALLERVEKMARGRDPRVVQVMAGLAAEYDVVMVARADGTLAAGAAQVHVRVDTVFHRRPVRTLVAESGGASSQAPMQGASTMRAPGGRAGRGRIAQGLAR